MAERNKKTTVTAVEFYIKRLWEYKYTKFFKPTKNFNK